MLGIILGLFNIGARATGEVVHGVYNSNRRREAYHKGEKVFHDSSFGFSDVKTGKPLILSVENGDKVFCDLQGNVVYNLSEEERQEYVAERKAKLKPDETAVFYQSCFYRKKKNGFDEIQRFPVYIDLKTNRHLYERELYLCNIPINRQIKKHCNENYMLVPMTVTIYVDVNTDIPVRLADGEPNFIKEFEREIIEWIKSPESDKVHFKWKGTDPLPIL